MDAWFLSALVIFLSIVSIPVIAFGIVYMYYGIRYFVPYIPSSKKSIDEMLSHVEHIEKVTLLDPGSGAGDIILETAHRGGRAIGIEINPFLVWITRWRAAREGVSDRITVICGNMFTVPLPQADVVTLYLLKKLTIDIAPKLAAELPPHARIISHGFPVPGWTPLYESTEVKVYELEPISK